MAVDTLTIEKFCFDIEKFCRLCVAKAVGHESGAPRELAIGPGRNLMYKDGLFFIFSFATKSFFRLFMF